MNNDGIRQMFLIYTHLLSNHMVFLSCPKSAWTMAKQWDNSERHSTQEIPRGLFLNYNSFQFAGCMKDKSVP